LQSVRLVAAVAELGSLGRFHAMHKLALFLTLFTAVPTLSAGPRDRATNIVAALKLFGMGTCQSGSAPDFAAIIDVINTVNAALTKRPIAIGLPDVVKRVAVKHPTARAMIRTTEQPAFDRVRSILGAPDSTETDNIPKSEGDTQTVTITWYEYGWCHFGVADAKVIIVRADCKSIKRQDAP